MAIIDKQELVLMIEYPIRRRAYFSICCCVACHKTITRHRRFMKHKLVCQHMHNFFFPLKELKHTCLICRKKKMSGFNRTNRCSLICNPCRFSLTSGVKTRRFEV